MRSSVIPRLLSIVLAAMALPAAARAQTPGVIDGLVADTALRPLDGATIAVFGTAVHVETGASGRFRIAQVPAGQYLLIVRKLGFRPVSGMIAVGGNDTLRLSYTLEPATPTLDTVRVVGELPTSARFSEFEARRANHLTAASITREDILKRHPSETWQILTNVPSLHIADRANLVVAVSTRTVIAGFNDKPCYMRVMVDGIEQRTDRGVAFDLRSLPPPEAIHGIEVFSGPATIPLQYGGIGDPTKWCGLIAIWTR